MTTMTDPSFRPGDFVRVKEGGHLVFPIFDSRTGFYRQKGARDLKPGEILKLLNATRGAWRCESADGYGGFYSSCLFVKISNLELLSLVDYISQWTLVKTTNGACNDTE